MYKTIIKYTAALLILTTLFFSLQRLLTPKYMSDIYDGALISEYYPEPKNHSVIFIGDCEVYQNFSPHELFNEYGITSYIRGGASQTMWQSYYLLADTLRYEKPDVVVLSVLGMGKAESVSEPYNRLNIEGMRLSAAKLNAIEASAFDGEKKINYLFPIFRYHDRWKELTGDDFKYFFRKDNVGLNGYLMRSETVPVTIEPQGARLVDYTLPPVCFEYLDKMRELCEKKGIQLILIKSPSIWPYWYEQWDEQVSEYARRYSLLYYNLLKMHDETGIDYNTDTANAGRHMNVYGAEKLSRWLGGELIERFNITDFRNDIEIAAIWAKKTRDYNDLKAVQLREFEQNGEISTVIYKKTK
ncbi:MAG: SGNH/GDSL hydrolase family protein [Oscillospiraceae bacterium]|nr:SGNH/GDSL hydrolase family protein [Oscillospiraceae bacterium]